MSELGYKIFQWHLQSQLTASWWWCLLYGIQMLFKIIKSQLIQHYKLNLQFTNPSSKIRVTIESTLHPVCNPQSFNIHHSISHLKVTQDKNSFFFLRFSFIYRNHVHSTFSHFTFLLFSTFWKKVLF